MERKRGRRSQLKADVSSRTRVRKRPSAVLVWKSLTVGSTIPACLVFVIILMTNASPGDCFSHPIHSLMIGQQLCHLSSKRVCHRASATIFPSDIIPSTTTLQVSFADDGSLQNLMDSRALSQLNNMRLEVSDLLRENDFVGGFAMVQEMLQLLRRRRGDTYDEQLCMSECVDDAIREFTRFAFSIHDAKFAKRVMLGAEMVQLQLSSSALVSPYGHVPRGTLLAALRALTSLSGKEQKDGNNEGDSLDAAFRIF